MNFILGHCEMDDALFFPERIPTLRKFIITNFNMSQIELRCFGNLRSLSLNNNNIASIEWLEDMNFNNLEMLFLSGN